MSVFPYLPNLVGGMLIGLSAGVLRIATGHIAGISGIVRGAITGPDRNWRLIFLLGLVVPGAVAAWMGRQDVTAGLQYISYPLLAIAGLLVGVGTGFGNGCTSGHGICGLARLSMRSLVAVVTFMLVAALTVFLVRHGVK